MENNEHLIQSAFIEWLSFKHKEVYKVTTSFPAGVYTSKTQRYKLSREGLKKGYPDVLIDYPKGIYHGFRVEFKYGRNKLQPAQCEWFELLESHGYYVCVAWSVDEAISHFENYINM